MLDLVLLQKCFEDFKNVDGVDYSIFNTDEYGDCTSCVNHHLCMEYGEESKGIFLKHWTEGMNGCDLKNIEKFYIAHDLNAELGGELYKIFSKHFDVLPKDYDESKCYEIAKKLS